MIRAGIGVDHAKRSYCIKGKLGPFDVRLCCLEPITFRLSSSPPPSGLALILPWFPPSTSKRLYRYRLWVIPSTPASVSPVDHYLLLLHSLSLFS